MTDPAGMELLRNAEVFAPNSLGLVDVLIAGGQIAWIGSGAPALPPAFEVLERDLSGARLVPGFVDGHAHVTGGGGESGYASRVPPMDPSAFTRAGVTSVVGLLGTDDTVRTTGELLAGVRGLCEVGLSAWCYTGGYHLPPCTLTGSLRGDIVHLDSVIGIGELALSDFRSSQPTLEILRAIRTSSPSARRSMTYSCSSTWRGSGGKNRRNRRSLTRRCSSTVLAMRVWGVTACIRIRRPRPRAKRGLTRYRFSGSFRVKPLRDWI